METGRITPLRVANAVKLFGRVEINRLIRMLAQAANKACSIHQIRGPGVIVSD